MTPPLIPPSQAQRGDIVIFSAPSRDFIGTLIKWFTRSKWNHVGVVVAAGANPMVAQATGKGVVVTPFSIVARGDTYLILRNPGNGELTARYAMSKVGARYGFLTIASIAYGIVTPRFLRGISLRRWGTFICSGLGALALLAGGTDVGSPDYYQVRPGGKDSIARFFGVDD